MKTKVVKLNDECYYCDNKKVSHIITKTNFFGGGTNYIVCKDCAKHQVRQNIKIE